MRRGLWFAIVAAGLTAGCAATYVKPNPGPRDHGIRYYRPKPYLVVKPAVDKLDKTSEGLYSVGIEYLPDFSEEYSIHIHAGLGTNKTVITLTDGWRLDSLNVDIDSKTDENIRATAKLLESAQLFTRTGDTPPAPRKILIRGNNVPIGYYEAVVSLGPDGVKHLYGWRYIGFMPFQPCPIESFGVDQVECHQGALFGIVIENDVMTMKPLNVIANSPVRVKQAKPAAAPEAHEDLSLVFEGFKVKNKQAILKTVKARVADPALDITDILLVRDARQTVIQVQVDAAILTGLGNKAFGIKNELKKDFHRLFSTSPLLKGKEMPVNLTPRKTAEADMIPMAEGRGAPVDGHVGAPIELRKMTRLGVLSKLPLQSDR